MHFTKILILFIFIFSNSHAQKVELSVTKAKVEVFDFQEFVLKIKNPDAKQNPFKESQPWAIFNLENKDSLRVEGFCDSADGSVFRLRFMPKTSGKYSYKLYFLQRKKMHSFEGSFEVISSSRKGILRLDPENPTHFRFDNGSRYFWNSTTAYWMLGLKNESEIMQSIDRLADYGINRIRVAINGRAHGGDRWNENTIIESKNFTFKLNPWPAEKPEDLDAPNFDVSRFEVGHWQKLDRLLSKARERGIVVSVIFYVDGLDHACDPFKKEKMGQEDEQMYYAYAAARYAAYENIMWDIANEYHLFRTPEWANKMGTYLKTKDPYKHLISVHGSADFPFRKSAWVDVIMHQSWDECGGYDFMMNAQKLQNETGRILPIINEEYGYEDHYAVWGCGATAGKDKPDGRNALNRSQLAWEICMTGSYQTTGESAAYGTGAGEDSGGGWINGRGNEKMTMLKYYKIMKETFEKTSYWSLKPRPDLVNTGNLCLANDGNEYLVYSRLQHCRIKLGKNEKYSVLMINPQTGEESILADADSNYDNMAWQYRRNLNQPMVFILKRR
jgi:hypothetical protein